MILHDSCYKKYQEQGTVVTGEGTADSGCSNHEFMEINRSDWDDDSAYDVVIKNGNDVTFKGWLGEMRVKYGKKEIPENFVGFLTVLADISCAS